MNLDKIKLFELVELEIDSLNPGRFFFTTQPQLRNQADQVIIIKGVQVYTVESYLNSQTTPGVSGLAIADVPKAVLVLYVNGMESIKSIPLANLINISGDIYQQEMQAFADLNNVDWAKSYVQFSTAPSQLCVIPFGVSYLKGIRSANDPTKWIEAN